VPRRLKQHRRAVKNRDCPYFLGVAPVEAVVLRREADPGRRAAERGGEALAHELRLVVLLREMRADDVLQLRAVERAEEARGVLVVEMAERAADALLEPARVGAAPEHLAVIVALEDQRVEAAERLLDVARADADVGDDAKPRGAVRD